MLTKDTDKSREQVHFFCMDDLVPKDHLLRDIERAIDFSFIYELVSDKYSEHQGRPSLDPVTLIKIPLIQYLYGIKSMRQTIKDIEVNMAYRWFLGLDVYDAVPHFSTFGKNYTRRFKETNLFEQIFEKILEECFRCELVETSTLFVDATHIKARANKHKAIKKMVRKEAAFYEAALQKEINKDREEKGKKPFDDDDDDSEADAVEEKETTMSTSDPESGLFHKGEHKIVYAYSAQTVCDAHGWILGYTVHPGNEHDSRTFHELYQKIKSYAPERLVADAGYKTAPIARMLIEDNITPVFPYTRPQTKTGFFRKYEYVYDEYYDCYICPNNQLLNYSTTTREGKREYKSNRLICSACPHLDRCTNSKNNVKVLHRHLWQHYLDQCEDIRHTRGMAALYQKRKETIERIFGSAKENHGMRYTHYVGKARMEMKVGLTYACQNLKKLAKIKKKRGLLKPLKRAFSCLLSFLVPKIQKQRNRTSKLAF